VSTITRRATRRAFTIIEVMFVLIIIGLIGSIVAINLVGVGEKARKQQTQASMKNIKAALKMYHGAYGSYPQAMGSAAMQALVDERFIEGDNLQDAWGMPFDYYAPAANGAAYELISYGPDKTDGTEDDLYEYPEHD
jgi:general secretion pathway protein G